MIFNIDFSVKFTDKHFNKIRHNHAVCNRRFCLQASLLWALSMRVAREKRHLGFGQVWACLSAVSVPVLLQFTGSSSFVTDLKNMADRQEWKGQRSQRFQKIHVRKTTEHEETFYQLSFKGMIRFYLNMEHNEVYGKFVLTICICSILYFCKKVY